MDESVNQNEKCQSCYLVEGCMLRKMSNERCGGPWKDEIERTDFIREQILEIKKEKAKKPVIKCSKDTNIQNKTF